MTIIQFAIAHLKHDLVKLSFNIVFLMAVGCIITYLIDFTWQFAHQIAGENNDGVLKGFLRR